VVEPGLRSRVEDRWREAYQRAGSGELPALRDADLGLVDEDSAVLGVALRSTTVCTGHGRSGEGSSCA